MYSWTKYDSATLPANVYNNIKFMTNSFQANSVFRIHYKSQEWTSHDSSKLVIMEIPRLTSDNTKIIISSCNEDVASTSAISVVIIISNKNQPKSHSTNHCNVDILRIHIQKLKKWKLKKRERRRQSQCNQYSTSVENVRISRHHNLCDDIYTRQSPPAARHESLTF